MVGLLVKLLITPVGIIVGSWIFPNVNFAKWFQPIILGSVAAVGGYCMERLMLREDTNWMTTIADFVVSSSFIYLADLFFVDAAVSFWGSILMGALFAVTEIFHHNWLIRNERAGMDDPVRE